MVSGTLFPNVLLGKESGIASTLMKIIGKSPKNQPYPQQRPLRQVNRNQIPPPPVMERSREEVLDKGDHQKVVTYHEGNNVFGTIRAVSGEFSETETVQESPLSINITDMGGQNSVIDNYSEPNMEDMVAELQTPTYSSNKRRRMRPVATVPVPMENKQESRSQELLLDSEFTLDGLIDKKVKQQQTQVSVQAQNRNNQKRNTMVPTQIAGDNIPSIEQNTLAMNPLIMKQTVTPVPEENTSAKSNVPSISRQIVENHDYFMKKSESEAKGPATELQSTRIPSLQNNNRAMVQANTSSTNVIQHPSEEAVLTMTPPANTRYQQNNTTNDNNISNFKVANGQAGYPQEKVNPIGGFTQYQTGNQSVPGETGTNKQNKIKDEQLLVEQQSPIIDIKTRGPKTIIVGQESLYQISVRNISTVDAQKLIVTTDIPNSVEVAEVRSSYGYSNVIPSSDGKGSIKNQWQLDVLPSGKEETLYMNLIPRQRSNFNLICHYDFEQMELQAGIEVQEPVLELQIDGRNTIEWGCEDKYRLRIHNSGNGDAQNVRLMVSTGDNEQATQFLNVLHAGEEKTMDLAVRTLLDGEIKITAEAVGNHGLSVHANRTVTVLRGRPEVTVEAPELQFVNNTVDYVIHVSNTGTAPLKNIDLTSILAQGVRFVSCTGNGRELADKGQVRWEIPMINIGEQIVYQVTCQMTRPGMNRMDISLADKTGLTAATESVVQVEAIAALNLRIKTPNGPVAIGTPLVYEVTITNTGTKAAENVSAGLFLNGGIKAVEVEGGNGVIQNGTQVVLNKVRMISAGQSVSWRITAQATMPGNHKVQAVLESPLDNIHLNSEEMTYCYERRATANRVAQAGDASVRVALRPVEQKPQQQPVQQQPVQQQPVQQQPVQQQPVQRTVEQQTLPVPIPQNMRLPGPDDMVTSPTSAANQSVSPVFNSNNRIMLPTYRANENKSPFQNGNQSIAPKVQLYPQPLSETSRSKVPQVNTNPIKATLNVHTDSNYPKTLKM